MKMLVIKIGGNILDNENALSEFIQALSSVNEAFVLVHGGGKLLNELAIQLNVPQQMVDGKRITSKETLDLALMTYAGLINKKLVARLNTVGKTAIGLSGADLKCIMSRKRTNSSIDYGEVGDVISEEINTAFIHYLLESNCVPVFCSISHSHKGELLNSNADAIAAAIAKALSIEHSVKLIYCFDKNGVLHSVKDDTSVMPLLDTITYNQLKKEQKIHHGMIAKLDHAFDAGKGGVGEIYIIHAGNLVETIYGNSNGTCIKS